MGSDIESATLLVFSPTVVRAATAKEVPRTWPLFTRTRTVQPGDCPQSAVRMPQFERLCQTHTDRVMSDPCRTFGNYAIAIQDDRCSDPTESLVEAVTDRRHVHHTARGEAQ